MPFTRPPTGRVAKAGPGTSSDSSGTRWPGLSQAERQVARIARRALLTLADSAAAPTGTAELARRLASTPLSALSALDFAALISALAPIRQLLAEQIAAAANANAARLGLALSFAKVDPAVVRAAELAAGRMITHISDTSREGIRRLVTTAFATQQLTVDDITRLVRLSIGLTARQTAQAHLAYTRALTEALQAGMSPAQAQARAERIVRNIRHRALTHRAATIARTEVMAASNTGKLLSWRGADAAGLIRAGTTKEWITSSSGACPTCTPMNGTRIPWNGEFAGIGAMPPAHPNCRCTAVLRAPTPATAPRSA